MPTQLRRSKLESSSATRRTIQVPCWRLEDRCKRLKHRCPRNRMEAGRTINQSCLGMTRLGMNPLNSSPRSSGEAGTSALATRADHTTAGVGAHPYTETRDALPLAVCSSEGALGHGRLLATGRSESGILSVSPHRSASCRGSRHRHIAGGLHQGVELIHALPLGVEQLDVKRVVARLKAAA